MNRTTTLDVVKSGALFTWGVVLAIHTVGKYDIIEYHPWKTKSFEVLTGEPDTSKVHYHCYVEGKNTACSYESLDEAIAYCIAYKHEGNNTHASYYFMKMIKGRN